MELKEFGGGRAGRRNAPDLFFPRASFDLHADVPLSELVEVASYVKLDLEEAGFSDAEIRRIGAILGRLSRSGSGGVN